MGEHGDVAGGGMKLNYGFIICVGLSVAFVLSLAYLVTRDNEPQPVIYLDQIVPPKDGELWELNPV